MPRPRMSARQQRWGTRLAVLAAALVPAGCSTPAPAPVTQTIMDSFALISDWGGTGSSPFTTSGQTAAASALDATINNEGLSFVVSAGNNFMPSGLPGGADDPATETRFMSTWQTVYTADVPWYVTGGYMDWMGNETAQRALSGSDGGRWTYPDLWHTFTIPLAETGETLQVVLVDTVTLAGAMLNNPGTVNIPEGAIPGDSTLGGDSWEDDVKNGSPPSGGAAGVSPGAGGAANATAGAAPSGRRRLGRLLKGLGGSIRRKLHDYNLQGNPPISTVQWSWLSTTLSISKANWIIVVGNDPIWSVGAHGPTWALVDQMLPILNTYGVALYISGRDPVAQHIAPSITYPAIDFIGIGNGANCNASQAQWTPMITNIPSNSLRFVSGSNTGFATITYTGSTVNGTSALKVQYYDSTGAVIYSFFKTNPRSEVPVIPLDKLQEEGVETVLNVQTATATDPYAATVSPVVMLGCMAVIIAVLGIAYVINKAEGDETTQIAKTAAKIVKEKDVGWGPAQQAAAARAAAAESGGSMGIDQERTSVVRGGNAANSGAAERRPLLPKHRLKIDSELREMCIDTPVGTSGLLVAQQVSGKVGSLSSAPGLCKFIVTLASALCGYRRGQQCDVPALIVQTGSAPNSVQVHWLVPSEIGHCPNSDVPLSAVRKLQRTFRFGDAVYRATLGFTEENATVVRPARSSPGYTTIELANGLSYSSKDYRLRHVPAPLPPAPITVPDDQLSPAAAREPCAFLQLFEKIRAAPAEERERALHKLVNNFRPDGGVDKLAAVNHYAFDGWWFNVPFLKAVKAACERRDPDQVVDVVFHGTEPHNVQSILSQSLTVSRYDGRFWMARSTETTAMYGPSTIVLAALHDKAYLPHEIMTSDFKAHQLPLGHA